MSIRISELQKVLELSSREGYVILDVTIDAVNGEKTLVLEGKNFDGSGITGELSLENGSRPIKFQKYFNFTE